MGKIIKVVSAILTGGIVGAGIPGEVADTVTNPDVANQINVIIGAAVALLMLWLDSWKKKRDTLEEE